MSAGDRDNFSGDREVTAPTGGYTKGGVYAIQEEYVVARETVSASATCLVGSIFESGTIEANKETGTGEDIDAGDQLYFTSSATVSKNSSGNTKMSSIIAAEDATTAATTVKIRRGAVAEA